MSKFQWIVVALLAVIAIALLGVLNRKPAETPPVPMELTREQRLQKACDAHPGECELMKRTNQSVDYEISKLRVSSPEITQSIDKLRRMQREMEDDFIRTGKYGE